MRITFLMGRLPARTGGEVYNFHLQEHLRKLGFEVVPVHVRPWHVLTSLPLAMRPGLLIADEHFTAHLMLMSLLRRLLGRVPLVVVCHHLDGYRRTWLERPLRWARLCLADRIVAVSQHTREELVSLGLPPERIEVVHPGYAPRDLPDPSAEAPGPPVKLLCVAPSVPRKGLGYLLKAMTGVDRRVRLHIVGDTDTNHHRRVLQPLVRRLGLADRVTFEGRVTAAALSTHYASAHLFVLPSLREGFGIVLLEAMHSGLPIVASRAAAIPELVEDGVTGLLVPPRDAQALARAIQKLVDDPEAGRRMGQEGRRRVLGRFSWERTCAEFVQAVRSYLK